MLSLFVRNMFFGLRMTVQLCSTEIYDMDNICGFSATSTN